MKRGVGPLAGLLWNAGLSGFAQVSAHSLDRSEGTHRRGVGGQRGEHPDPLADEGVRQWPVAVERDSVARPRAGVDDLKRNLRASRSGGGELGGRVGRERRQGFVKGGVAHARGFVVQTVDPPRRTLSCSRLDPALEREDQQRDRDEGHEHDPERARRSSSRHRGWVGRRRRWFGRLGWPRLSALCH